MPWRSYCTLPGRPCSTFARLSTPHPSGCSAALSWPPWPSYTSPASVGRLLGLAIVQLLDVAYYLPVVPNHWLLTGILSLTILGAAAGGALRGGRAGLQLGELYQTLVPPVRLSAAIFYFFTFFHKLNTDFLNPDMSCAVRFFERAVSPFPALSALPGIELVVIGATLTVELFLAVGPGGPALVVGRVSAGRGLPSAVSPGCGPRLL